MADVFISYAREDQEFVRKMCEALKAHGREAWVDWTSIPPTVEWLSEIFGGIEGAAVFVFPISPESVRSPVCEQEGFNVSGISFSPDGSLCLLKGDNGSSVYETATGRASMVDVHSPVLIRSGSMNTPEAENTNRHDDPAAPDLPAEEIKKEKPLVRSLTEEEPEDQDLESDKPNLPPAMPPLM